MTFTFDFFEKVLGFKIVSDWIYITFMFVNNLKVTHIVDRVTDVCVQDNNPINILFVMIMALKYMHHYQLNSIVS